jgi:hypothetical protein
MRKGESEVREKGREGEGEGERRKRDQELCLQLVSLEP